MNNEQIEIEPDELTVGRCARWACIMEATAPKVGNVHPGADFEDLTYYDFVSSAAAIELPMEAAHAGASLGSVVLEAVRATQAAVGTNSNLGMILLLAPLACVPRNEPLATGIVEVLEGLTAHDSTLVYQAIREASPGGLGKVDQADIDGQAPPHLLDAMRLAAERDLVAAQYANQFRQVLTWICPWLLEADTLDWPPYEGIVFTHLRLLARVPDSLIARKCGFEVAQDASARARHVMQGGFPGDAEYQQRLADFDQWLRSDGHRRNPGTSADLIAAGLFCCLRDGLIKPLG